MTITWEQFVDTIAEHIKDDSLREKLKPDISLEDPKIGFDSLGMVELTMMFEGTYDIELTEIEMQRQNNAGDIHNLINEKINERSK